jgi:hypothetical protein
MITALASAVTDLVNGIAPSSSRWETSPNAQCGVDAGGERTRATPPPAIARRALM